LVKIEPSEFKQANKAPTKQSPGSTLKKISPTDFGNIKKIPEKILSLDDFYNEEVYDSMLNVFSIIKDEVELDNIPTDFSEYSKRCSFCQEVKSLDYFYKNKTSSDGYSSRCTLCYKHSYQLHREVANAQALKRHYEKKNKAVPDHVDTMAKNKVEYRSKSKYWETSEYKAQIKQRQDEKKARWRTVFDERRADIEQLINAYEADPAESQNLIIEFHHVVRPNWKLNYGKRTELYERGARQGNYNC
jgi:ribosomal protein L39E